MKKSIFFLMAIIIWCATAQADELLRFNQTNFDGWTYTCPGTELSTDLISHNRVYLYKDGEVDYTLVSPLFNIEGITGLEIEVRAYSTNFDDPDYNASLGSPTVELLDADGNVLQSKENKFTTKELERNFTVSFAVGNMEQKNICLRMACWDATMVTALSARRIIINSSTEVVEPVAGDVNGDGSCTSSDVTALYNYILYNDSSAVVNGDQNGDGSITSSDVTAVYNIILGL